MGEIADEEVGEHHFSSPNANIRNSFTGQFTDEEDQPAETTRKLSFRRSVVQVTYGGVNLPQEYTSTYEVRLQLLENEIRRHHRTQGGLGGGAHSIVHDTELRTQLTTGTGDIDGTEGMLPETAAHGEQGVIVDNNGPILCPRTNARPGKLAVDFTSMGVQDIFDGLPFIRPFRQNDATCHCLNISIRELNANGKARGQALEQWDMAR
jgi:hypothetical protein